MGWKEMECDFNKLQKEKIDLQATMDGLIKNNANLKKQFDENRALQEKYQKLESVNREYDKLKKENDDVKEKNDDLMKECEQMNEVQSKYQEAIKENVSMSQKMNAIKTELDEMRSKYNEIKKECNSIKDQNDIKKKYQELENKYQEQKICIECLEKTKHSLESELKMTKKQSLDHMNSFKSLTLQNIDYQQQIEIVNNLKYQIIESEHSLALIKKELVGVTKRIKMRLSVPQNTKFDGDLIDVLLSRQKKMIQEYEQAMNMAQKLNQQLESEMTA